MQEPASSILVMEPLSLLANWNRTVSRSDTAFMSGYGYLKDINPLTIFFDGGLTIYLISSCVENTQQVFCL